MIERLIRAVAASLRTFSDALTSTSSPPATPQPTSSATWDSAVVEAMKAMTEQTRMHNETILSVLQGRPPETGSEPMQSPVTQTLLVPNYDDDSIPLSAGIETIREREKAEDAELRALLSERERLARQLAEAAAAQNVDRQGPSPSS